VEPTAAEILACQTSQTAEHQAPHTELAPTSTPEDSAECLLDAAPGCLGRRLASLDWDFADARTDAGAHSLHPYPAKFIPQLARQAILALSRPGDLILDPFSGGGTGAVEAVATDRRFFGIDANPVANAIALAKTRGLGEADVSALRSLEAMLLALQSHELTSDPPAWLPDIPKVEKWYGDEILCALGVIRERIVEIGPEGARELALLAFTQAAARVSFQESETRYASRPRAMNVLDAPRAVIGELRRMRRALAEAPTAASNAVRIVEGDSRDPASFELEPESAGLIVTSPPYPNAYDYHLYHRFRLFWLGRDPAELRRVEIGSHLTGQAVKNPADAYLADIERVLANCRGVLKGGRYAVVVLGDGLFGGELFETADRVTTIATRLGYEHTTTIDRQLPANRRSVTKPGRRLASEQLVVLRRPVDERDGLVIAPNYQLVGYERELQIRELQALGGSPRIREDGAIEVFATPRLHRSTFCHGIEIPGGQLLDSPQRLIEEAQPGSRRKNSTYFAHGIHRYKGKFYPQLAKSLLNLCGLEPGRSLVVDPFGGSGTVALEATLNGIDALSIDCNPLATEVARAKLSLTAVPHDRCLRAIDRLHARVSAAPRNGSRELTQFAPATLPELESWFPEPVLRKLDWLLASIRRIDAQLMRFFEVLVSDLIREVSQQEPRDLRIRRRSQPIEDAPVYELFLTRLGQARERLSSFSRLITPRLGRGVAELGDSADPKTLAALLEDRPIDAVVSSPPYAAALPYIDTDRLSLSAVLGLSTKERKTIEARTIGSREITERQRVDFERRLDGATDGALPQSTRSFLLAYREAVESDAKAGFRRRQAPAVLLRYFESMSAVFCNLKRAMACGAPCWLVLGDSRSTIGGQAWTIPTVAEVTAIAESHDFRVIDRIPITVTREDGLHSRHAITHNQIIQLRA
jgi:DNA modification methylase